MIKKHALQYKTRLLPKQNDIILRDRQVRHVGCYLSSKLTEGKGFIQKILSAGHFFISPKFRALGIGK